MLTGTLWFGISYGSPCSPTPSPEQQDLLFPQPLPSNILTFARYNRYPRLWCPAGQYSVYGQVTITLLLYFLTNTPWLPGCRCGFQSYKLRGSPPSLLWRAQCLQVLHSILRFLSLRICFSLGVRFRVFFGLCKVESNPVDPTPLQKLWGSGTNSNFHCVLAATQETLMHSMCPGVHAPPAVNAEEPGGLESRQRAWPRAFPCGRAHCSTLWRPHFCHADPHLWSWRFTRRYHPRAAGGLHSVRPVDTCRNDHCAAIACFEEMLKLLHMI